METPDTKKVYDDTLNRMKIILKNIKTTAPAFSRKSISNLKVDLAKKIRDVDKYALEEHIHNKTVGINPKKSSTKCCED